LTLDKASASGVAWRAALVRDERGLILAEDSRGIVGAAQLALDQP
jgi:hypothetical protein